MNDVSSILLTVSDKNKYILYAMMNMTSLLH